MREQAAWIAVVGVAFAGCVLEPVELTGRGCPCLEGWVCDESRDLCVREGDLRDAGPRDAGGLDARTMDARVLADARPEDSGSVDSGLADSGSADSGLADSGLADAGPPDAGPPDSGPPDAGVPVCVPGLLFCDDFESGDLSRWAAIETPLGGSVAATTSAVFRGDHSLRIVAAPGTRARVIASLPTAGLGEYHYRGWVRVWTRDTDARVDAFELAATSGPSAIRGEILPLDRLLGLRAIPPLDPEMVASSAAGAWDTRSWACVAGRVVVGEAPTGRVELYQGTRLDVMLADVDTAWGAPLEVFAITVTANVQSADVRFDEVLWSATPVSCP